MKKMYILLFSLLAIAVSVYGIIRPTYFIQLLFDLSPSFMLARMSLAFMLLLYVFWPEVRTTAMKTLMRLAGLGYLLFGVITFISPTMLGYFDQYVPIGDVGLFLEGGILALLLAALLPIRRPHLVVATPAIFKDIAASQFWKMLHTT